MTPSPTGGASSPSARGVRNITAGWPSALFQARDWREAAKESRAALRLNPADLKARELLIRCELRLKDHEAALKEFQTLLEFDPPNRDELIRRFTSLSRARGGGP